METEVYLVKIISHLQNIQYTISFPLKRRYFALLTSVIRGSDHAYYVEVLDFNVEKETVKLKIH